MADVSLNSNAVITEETYLRTVGKAKDNPKIDNQQLVESINQVSTFLEEYLRRKIVTPAAAIAETITGTTGPIYWVENARILSITTVEEFNNVNAAGTIEWDTRTIADYPYVFDQDIGRFEFVDGQQFDNQRWRLTYTTGWAQSDVPGPIRSVAISLVQRQLKLVGGKDGLSSQNFGDQSTTYDLDQQLTRRHKTLLSRYRRM